jgi:diacylglycerol kinase
MRLKRLWQSVRHAMHGMRVVWRTEQNFRIQVVGALLSLVFVFVLRVSTFESIVVLLMNALVLVLELVNSIFERLVDAFKPRIHPVVQEIKDIMAATVLVASLAAVVIGLVVFLPRFLDFQFFTPNF